MVNNSPDYDSVFRTLLNDCSSLIIPVINEVFGEQFTGDEEIVFKPNEHFLNRQGGDMTERITDSNFAIIGKVTKDYHWECQAEPDSTLTVRFFEYDTQIALDNGVIIGHTLEVSFPHSAVLFLRHNSNTPDHLTIKITTPGGTVSYDIPVVKAQTYSIETIFEKKLLFLIPFYIFSHESRFADYETDDDHLQALKAEYQGIKQKLEALAQSQEISEYTKCTILDMSGKVLNKIAERYDRIKEEVASVMAGPVLEYEAKTILNRGRNEGRIVGRSEGLSEGRRDAYIDMVIEGDITPQKAAEKLGIDVDAVTEEVDRRKLALA